jgi:hypothetical protein
MTDTDGPNARNDIEALRRFADMRCLWRLCANPSCRRAQSCRGRAHLCAKRNFGAVPDGAREFFEALLAAKYAGLSFDEFKSEMEQSEELASFSAWRKAAEASPR